jgi:predicted peroxiredoxin
MRANPVGMLLALLCCAALSPPAAAATAKAVPQEPMGKLVVILSSADPANADAAIRIAGVAASRGHQVTMLLRVRAIQFALRDSDRAVSGVPLRDKLARLMKGGSQVFVGGGCMKLQGIAPKRLLPGVQVGTPDSVMGMIFEKNARIISQ